jgi:hypothetical protein
VPQDLYDDDDGPKAVKASQLRFTEFDCPGCNANNPVDPPFGDRAELLCNYCGMAWESRISDEGKLSFREL